MVQNKLSITKSTEELLKDLEAEDVVSAKVSDEVYVEDSIISFIRYYNIQPGIEKIKTSTLLKMYISYTKNPVSDYTFHLKMHNYLGTTKNAKQRFYLINQKAINLSEKALKVIENKKRDKIRSPKWKLHYDNFLKKFDIQPGKENSYIWISTDVLYDLYDEWTYSIKKERSLNYKQFISFCKIYFENKQNNGDLYYKLDDSISSVLTPERISAIRARKSLNSVKKEKSKK